MLSQEDMTRMLSLDITELDVARLIGCEGCKYYDGNACLHPDREGKLPEVGWCQSFEAADPESAAKKTIQYFINQIKSRKGKVLNPADIAEEELFFSDEGVPYCRFPVLTDMISESKDIIENVHYETWRLDSERVFNYYLLKLWQDEQELRLKSAAEGARRKPREISEFAVKRHIALLNASINMRRRISHSVAWDDGAVVIDLKNDDWQALRVGKGMEYSIVDASKYFYRYPHDLPFEVSMFPISVESARKILRDAFRKYFHVRLPGDEQLLMVDLVATLVPEIPKPILVLFGSQGAAKSTTMVLIKRILSPSQPDLLAMPMDTDELIRIISQYHVAFFDNVSSISRAQSDVFCRAVTGEGLVKRKLYHNNENEIYTFVHKIGLNGINIAGTSPDFLDRSLTIELDRISSVERRTIRSLMLEFERDVEDIRRALLSVLSTALELRQYVRMSRKPRMADYAMWGEAISRALGFEDYSFYKLYLLKMSSAEDVAVESSVVGVALSQYIRRETTAYPDKEELFRGSVSDLLKVLREIAVNEGIDVAKQFPKAPHILTRRLNEVKANFKDVGWSIELGRKYDGRFVVIKKNLEVENLIVELEREQQNNGKNTIISYGKKRHSEMTTLPNNVEIMNISHKSASDIDAKTLHKSSVRSSDMANSQKFGDIKPSTIYYDSMTLLKSKSILYSSKRVVEVCSSGTKESQKVASLASWRHTWHLMASFGEISPKIQDATYDAYLVASSKTACFARFSYVFDGMIKDFKRFGSRDLLLQKVVTFINEHKLSAGEYTGLVPAITLEEAFPEVVIKRMVSEGIIYEPKAGWYGLLR